MLHGWVLAKLYVWAQQWVLLTLCLVRDLNLVHLYRWVGEVVEFRTSNCQTFLITLFSVDLPSGENLQQWPLALLFHSLHPTSPFHSPVLNLWSECWKGNKRIQRNNIWGHLSWGCHSGNSRGFWGNILLFFYYGREWETSEKHTSQLFSFKNRSRVIKVDALSKFYNLLLFLLPFIHSSHLPSCLFSFPSVIPLTSWERRNMLPGGSAESKHPVPPPIAP